MFVLKKINFSVVRTLRNCTRTFVNVIYDAGEVKSSYEIPDHIVKPHYFYKLNDPPSFNGLIEIKSQEQIQRIRESCKIAANILKKCHEVVKVSDS